MDLKNPVFDVHENVLASLAFDSIGDYIITSERAKIRIAAGT